MRKAGFVVSAPCSGAGKTTVTRALMAALVRRGLRVQPFKCGPDYIDTKFHSAVCGRPSINLDTFLASPGHVCRLFARYGEGADVCVVEGMMGLFDGYDRSRGSTAEIARLLGLPVVMVVDARHAGYSVAPLLRGFATFDESVPLAGVLFNNVGSLRHERLLRQASADAGLDCFGCLPHRRGMDQPSRYLGLDFSQALCDDGWVQWIEEHVAQKPPLAPPFGGESEHHQSGDAKEPSLPEPPQAGGAGGLPIPPRTGGRGGASHIVVARSPEAFSFIYQEHLDLLASCGRVTFFDPSQDGELPADTDLLYLPGGYPEQHAASLQAASRTRHSIRRYAEDGGRILAECGGMIYLCERLLCDDGSYDLCGVLPYTISARSADRHLSLGYRRISYNGLALKGHEFHYTQFGAPPAPPIGGETSGGLGGASVCDACGAPVPTPFFRHRNVLASYTHLYWGELSSPFQLFGE